MRLAERKRERSKRTWERNGGRESYRERGKREKEKIYKEKLMSYIRTEKLGERTTKRKRIKQTT